MIGDQTRDVEMARRAGLRSILCIRAAGRDGQFPCAADYVAPDLSEAAAFVLSHREARRA